MNQMVLQQRLNIRAAFFHSRCFSYCTVPRHPDEERMDRISKECANLAARLLLCKGQFINRRPRQQPILAVSVCGLP